MTFPIDIRRTSENPRPEIQLATETAMTIQERILTMHEFLFFMIRTLIRVSQRRRIRSLRSRKSSTDTRRLPKRKRKQSVLCRRFPKRSRKPLKPIGRPFTGSRRNPRSRKRGERNGSTKGTPADRGAFRHAR